MYITLKARLRAGMAIAALVPAMAFASTVSVNGDGDVSFAGDVVVSRVQPASSFLSWASRPSSVPGTSIHTDSGATVFVPPTVSPSVSLRGGADLSLWNLVAAVHAQQRGDSFKSVETGVTVQQQSLVQVTAEPLSVVPLPPAVWLFVMGVLGLAGTRVTRSSGARQRSSAEGAAHGFPSPAWGGALSA